MKQCLFILYLVVSSHSCLSQQVYSDIKIEDKNYFSCYRNPFSRFKTVVKEFVWLSGMYNQSTLLNGLSLFLIESDKSADVTFRFTDADSVVLDAKFIKVRNIKNGYELKVAHSSKLQEDNWNCSRFIGAYSLLIKEKVELYYADKLIMTFSK